MQKLNQRTVNNLIKGLVTEAGELTFPENASVDELNCSLGRDGARSRRLGLDFEPGYELSSFTVDPTKQIFVGQWDNPAGIAGLSFMVVQAGSALYFYNSANAPYSAQYTGLSIDLASYSAPNKSAADYRFEFAVIASVLVVAGEGINTVYLTYDGVAITATQIEFRIRDFDWQSDICDLTEQIPTSVITIGRKYDTFNVGWSGNFGDTRLVGTETIIGALIGTLFPGVPLGLVNIPNNMGLTALENYVANRGAWPPLTHPWYSGKNSDGNFDLSTWLKVYSGSSLIGNGHYVLDFFNKDRNAVSGLVGLPVEIENERFRSVASYAGRMFYAGLGSGKNAGKILYSRIVETINQTSSCTIIGECSQQNDPVSEYYSDLLETDGGVIHIPEANNIKKLYTHNQYLYVFADNGVWVISGPESRFSATSYYVSKVSNVGIYTPTSFVSAEGVPFWWSKYGIHTFSYDESSGFPIEQNLSIATIQSFWEEIDTNAKENVTAAYDRVNKQIFWLYPANGETSTNRKTEFLILDIPLQAFYPWRITAADTYAADVFFFDAYGATAFDDEIFDNSEAAIVDANGDSVWVTGYSLISNALTQIGILTLTANKLTISTFNSIEFRDWTALDYDSFVECGYDFGGDLLLKKTAPYVTVYCRSTEEGFGFGPDYKVINASGLYMGVYWDFKDYASTRQQVYKPKPTPVVDPSDLSDTGQNKSVVVTRLKVRGSGRSMRLRFEAEEGKNFVLLGYSVLIGVNARF
jgi:hypothetical protein